MSHAAGIAITADDPRAPIDLGVEDDELPPSLDLPTWLVLAATGPALKLAHLIVLLHRQPPADRPVTRDLLAALLGKSVDRVDAYAKELERVGWLTIQRRRVNGWQVPNEYRYRHSPRPGSVVPRTVGDLMATVDARLTTLVDNSKTAGRAATAKTRLRSRTDAATTPDATQNRRSERSRISTATQPQKCGPYKELTYCSSSLDRSIDRDTPGESEPPAPALSDAARALVRGLDYGAHLPPSSADVDVLAGLVDAAVDHGLTLAEVRAHCQAALGRCRSAVVPYLAGALAVDRLPTPRQVPVLAAAGSALPPACPACLAEYPAAQVNPRLRFREGRMCDCHPDAVSAVVVQPC